MLDLDGTIYQTLDLKERGWHATTSNDRSIGIEIANIGAYSDRELASEPNPLTRWYATDQRGAYLTLPDGTGDGGIRTPGFMAARPRPVRPARISGEVQGRLLHQYDLTAAQYDSLIKLTAALCRVFPKIRPDYPRDADGHRVTRALRENELRAFQGVLGHYHVQDNKSDPGPALQWDAVIGKAPLERGTPPSAQ
jgi:N-acetyl-anhydromuramyl-L-alanine amidase AmpD